MSNQSFRHPVEVADAHPAKAAIIMADSGRIIDYETLVSRSNRLANLFAHIGIAEGDTIAFLVENSERYLEMLWAAKNSGLRYVCVSTHLDAGDIGYIISDSGAKLLVASHALRDLAAAAVGDLPVKPILYMVGGIAPGFSNLDAAASDCADIPLIPTRRRGSSMLYSSGTTGRPKGVKTELMDVAPQQPPQRFAMLQEQYGLGPDTVFINPGPFYHAGPNRFMMSTLRAGGTVVAFEKFDAEAVLQAIGHHGVTHGFFVPTMFNRMLSLPQQIRDGADTHSLRHAIHAAAPCPVELKRKMIAWWGPVIDELYAGTEAFGHTFITSGEWLEHPGSVGKAARGCKLKIVDETGRALPTGEIGLIMMSNGLRISYHGDEGKTKALYDHEGYASLGDVGYLDQDGYLYLTDRESHMIIVGGVNIYPQEAENVIIQHPDILDVAVIGVPDADMGEQIKAIVELRGGIDADRDMASEIITFCRERLSLHKCPRSVDFQGPLPRNAMGKLLKRELKRPYWAGLEKMI